MFDFDYGFYHIERIWRIVRGDEPALDEMDISSDGFWRSFVAIIWALPALFFSWAFDARDLIGHGVELSMVRIVIYSAIIEMLLWFLPVILLAFVLKPFGLAQRYSHLIIARNWLSVPIVYAYVVIMLLGMFLGNSTPVVLFAFAFLLAAIWIQIRITRVSLQCEISLASGLVIGEFLLLLIIM
ncbi:MAG: hypothetical protein AAF870_02540, partial [Pseudomonadota bacterium]